MKTEMPGKNANVNEPTNAHHPFILCKDMYVPRWRKMSLPT